MGGIDGFGRSRPEGGPFSTVDSEGGRIQRGLHRPISGEDPLHVASVRNGPTDSFRCVSKVSEDRATATGRAGCGTGPSFLGFSGPRASNMNAWRLAPSGRQAGVDHPSSPQRLWPPSRKLPSRCLVVFPRFLGKHQHGCVSTTTTAAEKVGVDASPPSPHSAMMPSTGIRRDSPADPPVGHPVLHLEASTGYPHPSSEHGAM